MSHTLVYWIHENKYSVISAKKVTFDREAHSDLNSIVGTVCPVKWKKHQKYDAEIKAIGSKSEMEEQAGFWETYALENSFTAEEVEESALSSQQGEELIVPDELVFNLENQPENSIDGDNRGNMNEAENINEFVENGLVTNTSSGESMDKTYVQELEEKVKDLDKQLAKERAKNKLLARTARKVRAKEQVGEEDIEVGGGVLIPASLDNFLKASYTGNPSVFLRRLLFDGGVIPLEEIASSSLTGKRTTQSPPEGRPALDSAKFKILKDYTVKCCQLQPNTLEMYMFESKIRNICTDARKKLKTKPSSE